MPADRRRAALGEQLVNGAQAEDLALRYLEAQGLELVDRNVRGRGGELDLVMRDGETLVIVEVRKRSHPGFGSAAESVDARKRAKVILAARELLARRPALACLPARFDVVAIDGGNHVEWIRAAFDAGDA